MIMVKKVRKSMMTKKMVRQKLETRERGKMIARMKVVKKDRKMDSEYIRKKQVSRVKTVFRTKH